MCVLCLPCCVLCVVMRLCVAVCCFVLVCCSACVWLALSFMYVLIVCVVCFVLARVCDLKGAVLCLWLIAVLFGCVGSVCCFAC